ncbi:MAG: Asp-tRNA(Asn)/Glu-tRNA(Gln) amidotransferase GatCAB subunit C [Legionellaceae bacterium]|nr:Asp-tRNA(Asn)/Glu-tRNA(Gln) amidotransferase GatCAB subunit C [Legionellaceae bacterium]HAF87259.1 Asp-tRNA(Asn)/Glu-tRNA(Gln) amidotransferase subunit GatC [Legionellales bacterium]HCA89828.1 Asp-tRNA(Asn)/Glu-tRNA(Gln) amidotransferase subunit GatC [Legionellales bacterium]|tara:strand:+ start:2146 stop:2439 length:294 start_codon:yes stop_codon:yes gene_type:complete
MTRSNKAIFDLAHLRPTSSQSTQLNDDVQAILDFVATLSQVNTTHVSPLFHPLDLHPTWRDDTVTEHSVVNELAMLTDSFEEDLYWVGATKTSEASS